MFEGEISIVEDGWETKILVTATGRCTVEDAISWIAEDHPVRVGSSWTDLMRALVRLVDQTTTCRKALRRATREATSSDFDTSRILFAPEMIAQPSDFKAALEALKGNCADSLLGSLNAVGLLRAQQDSPLAIETLCLAVGVSYTDACSWYNSNSSEWTRDTADRLLSYLNDLIEGDCDPPVPGSAPSRGLEYRGADGWGTAETFIRDGVPYEVLLAQRAGGGVWLAHKNRTSSYPNISVANLLAVMLDGAGLKYLRATQLGGDVRQADLQALSGVKDKRVALVVLKEMEPAVLVCFSSAKDSGTARANGDGLLQIPVGHVPFAAVLTGLGWSGRTETDRLAQHFGGLLFTEKTLEGLVSFIRDTIRP